MQKSVQAHSGGACFQLTQPDIIFVPSLWTLTSIIKHNLIMGHCFSRVKSENQFNSFENPTISRRRYLPERLILCHQHSVRNDLIYHCGNSSDDHLISFSSNYSGSDLIQYLHYRSVSINIYQNNISYNEWCYKVGCLWIKFDW